MAIAADTAQLPVDATADLAYVSSAFIVLDPAMHALVEQGVLPRATYVLPDGTPMVPPDHATLLHEAGGDPNRVAAAFRERFLNAGGNPDDAEEEHEAWLSGEYGACLLSVTPEAMVAKGALMGAIKALLTRPSPADAGWLGALRNSVDALDALERPFAAYDRERFGGPVSRDRLITAPRERYPEAWRD